MVFQSTAKYYVKSAIPLERIRCVTTNSLVIEASQVFTVVK